MDKLKELEFTCNWFSVAFLKNEERGKTTEGRNNFLFFFEFSSFFKKTFLLTF